MMSLHTALDSVLDPGSSSCFGTNGGRGRCFPFFQELTKCYVQTAETEDCRLYYEDYMECLHGRKERQRLEIVKEHYFAKRKAEEEAVKRASEAAKKAAVAG
ncbi:hypothetical protein HK101_003311 [Irineochytrium annulatum]|nr:hypothetical protein HK101_003311 [Irineochytrium annulatum]